MRLGPVQVPRLLVVCGVTVVAAAGSWLAATTHPFTVGADVAVAVAFVPIVATFSIGVARNRQRAHPDVDVIVADRIWPWITLLLMAGAWEVAVYFLGFHRDRTRYPTLSYFYDNVAHWRAAKAALFFGWLALGWGLFKR